MKKTFVLHVLLILSVALLGSCTSNSTPSPAEDSERKQSDTSLGAVETTTTHNTNDELPTAASSPNPTQVENSQYTISIERVDKSLFTDNGLLMVEMWFELPTLSGDSEGVAKINAFYEQWCDEWLNGDDAQAILETLNAMAESKGDEYFLNPYTLTHVIGSTVMLLDKDTLSIAHTSRWNAGGSPSHSLYGNTFDIETGKLIECPYDITNLSFKEKLLSLSPQIDLFETTDKYFRDKDFIYIITRTYRGEVIRWNGKTDEEFDAERLYMLP